MLALHDARGRLLLLGIAGHVAHGHAQHEYRTPDNGLLLRLVACFTVPPQQPWHSALMPAGCTSERYRITQSASRRGSMHVLGHALEQH